MTDRERLIELIREMEDHPEKTCPYITENYCLNNCPYNKGETCDMVARKADYLLANGVTVSKPKTIRPPADLKGKCGSCIYAKPTTWGNSKVYVECTNAEHIRIYCRRGESARKRLRTAKACKSYIERICEI